MPRILIDHHHQALRYSLQLLFEKRLGWEVYTQIGMEWWDEKLWNVFPARETAQQYLGLDHAMNPPTDIRGAPLSPREILNANYENLGDGAYLVNDPVVAKPYAAMTLEKFSRTDFDVLLCSMPQHIEMWKRLQQMKGGKPKLIFQIGNSWGITGDIKNVLASCAPVNVPPGVNAQFYHQEFDLDTYRYEPPTGTPKIYSFVHYMKGKDRMNAFAARLPGWEVKSFGAGMEDSIMKASDLADKMREMAFGLHFKPEGDGFGHSLHGMFAVGRPPIIWGSHYRGKLAGQLMEHGKTCVDVESKELGAFPSTQVPSYLKELVESGQHKAMCEAAHRRFKEVVDFDREEQEIRKFIDRLI